jgi:hypothetical protein
MPKCEACGKENQFLFKHGKFNVCGECLRMIEIMDSIINAKCDGTCHRGNS